MLRASSRSRFIVRAGASAAATALVATALGACSGDDTQPGETTTTTTTTTTSTTTGSQGGGGGQATGGSGGNGGALGGGGPGGAGGGQAGGGQGGGPAMLCTDTGGTVDNGICCLATGNFPDMCGTGPCGCSPNNSHSVLICNCPGGKCYDPAVGCK